MKKLLGIFTVLTLFVLVGVLLKTEITKAQVIEKVYDREFTVEEEFVSVRETKTTNVNSSGFFIEEGAQEAFTIFFPLESDPNAKEKIRKTLDSVRVYDQNGTELPFNFEEPETNSNLIIRVPFPRRVEFNTPLTISLEYNSYGLLIKSGAIYDVYIPGFPDEYELIDQDSIEDINTRVILPPDAPELNFTLPTIEFVTNVNQERVFEVDFETLRGDTLWIQLGTEQYFEFNFSQEFKKTTSAPFVFNTYQVILPRNIDSGPIKQEVFFTKIEPNPYSVETDFDGNLVATFKVPANMNQSAVIEGYAVLTRDPKYDFRLADDVTNIPIELREAYLSPAEFWEVDNPEILQALEGLNPQSSNTMDIIDSTYQFVIDRIDYSFVKKYGLNERQGALATLRGGAAVCMEYSDLFITLMRAQGVPARAAFGYGYTSLDFETQEERRINHQWAEVYVPGLDTWIAVDTTWGDFGSNIIGGDLNHFYSHVASTNPETPSLLSASFFGSIDELPDRDMLIQVTSSLDRLPNELSSDEILERFAAPRGVDKIFTDSGLYLRNIDSQISTGIGNLFSIQDENSLNFVKIGIILLLVSPVILLFLNKTLKKG